MEAEKVFEPKAKVPGTVAMVSDLLSVGSLQTTLCVWNLQKSKNCLLWPGASWKIAKLSNSRSMLTAVNETCGCLQVACPEGPESELSRGPTPGKVMKPKPITKTEKALTVRNEVPPKIILFC